MPRNGSSTSHTNSDIGAEKETVISTCLFNDLVQCKISNNMSKRIDGLQSRHALLWKRNMP